MLQVKAEMPIFAVAVQLFLSHLLITVPHSLGAKIFHIFCQFRCEKVLKV